MGLRAAPELSVRRLLLLCPLPPPCPPLPVPSHSLQQSLLTRVFVTPPATANVNLSATTTASEIDRRMSARATTSGEMRAAGTTAESENASVTVIGIEIVAAAVIAVAVVSAALTRARTTKADGIESAIRIARVRATMTAVAAVDAIATGNETTNANETGIASERVIRIAIRTGDAIDRAPAPAREIDTHAIDKS